MELDSKWRELGSRHLLWDVLRFFLSIRGPKRQREWLDHLRERQAISTEAADFEVPSETIQLLFEYLDVRIGACEVAVSRLRTEAEAIAFCKNHGVKVRKTATRTRVHHQASKSLIGAVDIIARLVTDEVNTDPQTRCIWCNQNGLHVTARNVDGAVPSTANPKAIWEIKEYWGKTKGGSKMSDAVYEWGVTGVPPVGFGAMGNLGNEKAANLP